MKIILYISGMKGVQRVVDALRCSLNLILAQNERFQMKSITVLTNNLPFFTLFAGSSGHGTLSLREVWGLLRPPEARGLEML